MTLLVASLVVLAFAVLLARLRVLHQAREATQQAQESLRVFRDPTVDDDTKERTLRRNSLCLAILFAKIAGSSAVALLLPLCGVWLLERLGVASLAGVMLVLQRWDFLVVATGLGSAVYYVSRTAPADDVR